VKERLGLVIGSGALLCAICLAGCSGEQQLTIEEQQASSTDGTAATDASDAEGVSTIDTLQAEVLITSPVEDVLDSTSGGRAGIAKKNG
jgi:hypothetical protein